MTKTKKDDRPAGVGHNSGKTPQAKAIEDAPHSSVTKAAIKGEAQDVGGVAGARLKSLIERIEKLEEEKAAIGADVKDVYAEAKGTGFDVKTIRKLIRLRKMDENKRSEEDALLDLYRAAVGV